MEGSKRLFQAQRLIPVPRKLSLHEGAWYSLVETCRLTIHVAESGDVPDVAKKLCMQYWHVVPAMTIIVDEETISLNKDAYAIHVTEHELVLKAYGQTGVMNAFKTLRQLAEPNRGTERLQEYQLPPCDIEDSPSLAFRGIHLCLFPETPLWDVEKSIRLAAYHKFNVAVIESWGVFPFKSHPEFCWKDGCIDGQELKRLVRLGKELGITLIPQFNVLGHASLSRCGSGKHAILDMDESLQPLFEPDGWSWCLTNPETKRILTDLVVELHDFFDCPPYVHIGCDEAHDLGICSECSKHSLAELVSEHIRYFHDLLQKRGARTIMWHDMLLTRGDPRWCGYIACGQPEQHLEQLHAMLPKDIIMADWQYGYQRQGQDSEPIWPTMRFFQKENFEVLACPWCNEEGIKSLGRFAEENHLLGMLETTWHQAHGNQHLQIFGTAANAAWNPQQNQPDNSCRLAMARHLRQVGWDMKIDEYEKTGWNTTQINPGNLWD